MPTHGVSNADSRGATSNMPISDTEWRAGTLDSGRGIVAVQPVEPLQPDGSDGPRSGESQTGRQESARSEQVQTARQESPGDVTARAMELAAFVRENSKLAFTRAELVRGVQCRPEQSSDGVGRLLASLPNQLADLRADFEAGGLDVEGYSQAVDRLLDRGVLTCAHIERGDGEPVVYYRDSEHAVEAVCER